MSEFLPDAAGREEAAETSLDETPACAATTACEHRVPRGRVEFISASRADRRAAVDALLASRDMGSAILYLERVLAACLSWESDGQRRRGWYRKAQRTRPAWRRRRPAPSTR